MKDFIAAPVFRPSLLKAQRDLRTRLYPLNAAPVISEGRLIFDNTMPPRDWRAYDAPACKRMTARVVRAPKQIQESAFLRRQA